MGAYADATFQAKYVLLILLCELVSYAWVEELLPQ
jgi:hypothetical protein